MKFSPDRFARFLKVALSFAFFLVVTIGLAQPSTDEQLADQYFRNQEFDKAVSLYEKLYKSNSEDKLYRNYVSSLVALEQFDEAEKIVKKRLKKFDDHYSYIIDLGMVYDRAGDRKNAEKQYDKVIKQLPPNEDLIRDIANTFIGKGELDYAIKTYQKGRRIMAGMYAFHFELAEAYSYKQDIPAMFNEYLDAIALNQSNLNKVQEALQTVLADDVQGKKNELLQNLLIERIQDNPDRKIFAEMLIWHFIQQQDFNSAFIQAKAMDKRLKEDGSRLIELANIAMANREFDVAIDCYKYVIRKGEDNYFYLTSRMNLVEVMNQKIVEGNDYTEKDLQELKEAYLSAIDDLGRNESTVQLLRGYAHLNAFYLHNTEKAIEILQNTLKIPYMNRKDEADAKLELGDVYLLTGEVWEAKLLYGQVDKMFKNEPLGHEAKLRNAKASFYIGEFDWAVAQLNILKSATSQFIANDAMYLSLLITDNTIMDTTTQALEMFASADLLFFQNKVDSALSKLDSINALFPTHQLTDDILYKKAEIWSKRGEYEKAAGYLQKVIDGYEQEILGDDALFMLAEIYDYRLKDKMQAMQLYQDLLINHPGSLYTVEARKRYRQLRGDNIN